MLLQAADGLRRSEMPVIKELADVLEGYDLARAYWH